MSDYRSSRDRRRGSRSPPPAARNPRDDRGGTRTGRSRSRDRDRDRDRGREHTRSRGGDRGDRDLPRDSRGSGGRGNFNRNGGSYTRDPRDYNASGKGQERRTVVLDSVYSAVRNTLPGGTNHETFAQISMGFEDAFDQPQREDDLVIDEAAMEGIDKFLDGEDEEQEAALLAEMRRKRREEIRKKHEGCVKHDPDIAAEVNVVHVSESNNNFSDTRLDGATAGVGRDEDANIDAAENKQSEAELFEAEQQAVQEEALKNEPHAFDMFSSSPSDQEVAKAGLPKRASNGLLKASVLGDEGGAHLQSNYDDTEGYYKLTIGEIISDRYRTQGVVGKGVFSTVLKCVDLTTEETVAVKMIRNNDLMRKAAEKELSILTMLRTRDPENKKHCVRLLGHLEYRHHTTFVFESLQMNLRDALKKFGKNVGINVTAIRMYGRQLFIALKFLSDLQIVHADIKLDNILVSDDLKYVKICDFGSAFFETDPDRDPTPYLVSRFYRAPEIILGLQYDRMVDMFSVGTCLYELFTGHVMFPGRTNNDMLRLMQGFKGRLPNKMLKNHLRSYEKLGLDTHFDADFKFKQWDQDPVTGKPVLRLVDILQPTKDLSAILLSSKVGGLLFFSRMNI